MQITSRFTIAVHIITALDYFKDERKVTSDFLAGSIGANPVIVRGVIGKLKAAGIVSTRQGSTDTALIKPLDQVTFYDIYQAVDCVDSSGLFHFHENPKMECPVGRSIHAAMDARLAEIQAAMENEMKRITLADVVTDTRKEIEASGQSK